ncbi:MAG: hypothetical protein KAT93_06980 [Desulfuromonadales bacterium]|nr:hypothetical protein [Desulfuromonadales bacterium]
MMQFLLKPHPETGPSDDYLLARVRYRRSLLDLSGMSDSWPGLSPEEGLQDVFLWVFDRLNPTLFKQLRPYLELVAGHSLVLALRLYRAEKREALSHLLQRSLLHPVLQKQMLTTESTEQLVTSLETLLAPAYPELEGLLMVYKGQGPGGVEEQLEAGFLLRSLATVRATPVHKLLTWMVDLRNILSVAKYWRWQVEQEPPLLSGGTVAPVRLQRLWVRRDEAGLGRVVTRRSGLTEPPPVNSRSIEMSLLRGMTGELHRSGRDPLGLGVLVDYLWCCQVAARNRALLLNLEDGQGHLLNETLVSV